MTKMTLNFDRWFGKVAIVTGASSGIGAAIAERLVKEGLVVAGLARRKERIEELTKKLSNEEGKLHAIKTDITKEVDILKAFKWIKDNLGPIHILINNAGITNLSLTLISGRTEDWQKIIQTNVMGLSICTREAIQDMKSNKVNGHIIHINSICGHKTGPFPFKTSIYTASKHAVTALTKTLRLELNAEKSKVKITSISPGGVSTEIIDFSKLDKIYADEIIEKSSQGDTALLYPEDIADSIYYVLATPPHVQIHEMIIKPVGEIF